MSTLLEEIEKINFNKRIKIKARQLKTGYSLYLEFTLNYHRQREYLKIKISNNKTLIKKESENLYLAERIRDKKEIELYTNEHNFQLSNQIGKTKFFDYLDEILKIKNSDTFNSCYKHLEQFSKELYGTNGISFQQITNHFCNKFIEYLQSKVKQNSVRAYLNIFSIILNKAVKEKIITENPLNKKHIKYIDVKREFLSESELIAFSKQETKYKSVKRAFLFSCQTGLRFSDIKALSFKDIKEGFLYFRQIKTKGIERMKLTSDALKLIEEERKGKNETSKIFNIGYKAHINTYLRTIVESAGINKRITFHCGRHTFATRCITNGVDIFTVSKLLGHHDISITLIYAKLIDSKKDEYIDKLPQIL